MKGVSVIIASTLVIVISISLVYLALRLSSPGTDRVKEILLMQEAKNTIISIDNAVTSVSEEGQGSTRNLEIVVTNGHYTIDTINDAILFSMESFAQIVASGVFRTEDGINIRGESGRVHMNITYSNFNITGGTEFYKGSHNIVVKNEGYDEINQKQIINISA